MNINKIIMVIAIVLEFLLMYLSYEYKKKGWKYKGESNLCAFGAIIIGFIATIIIKLLN